MQAAPFLLRIAASADIEAMHRVRLAVRENRLADPSRVTPNHYRAMLEHRGRGWVYEDSSAPEALAGFGIADNAARNIWALFVQPGHEGRGIGRALHDAMVEWLFAVGDTPVWLTTDPNTRAAASISRQAGFQMPLPYAASCGSCSSPRGRHTRLTVSHVRKNPRPAVH